MLTIIIIDPVEKPVNFIIIITILCLTWKLEKQSKLVKKLPN